MWWRWDTQSTFEQIEKDGEGGIISLDCTRIDGGNIHRILFPNFHVQRAISSEGQNELPTFVCAKSKKCRISAIWKTFPTHLLLLIPQFTMDSVHFGTSHSPSCHGITPLLSGTCDYCLDLVCLFLFFVLGFDWRENCSSLLFGGFNYFCLRLTDWVSLMDS